jgi:hypothetical protein
MRANSIVIAFGSEVRSSVVGRLLLFLGKRATAVLGDAMQRAKRVSRCATSPDCRPRPHLRNPLWAMIGFQASDPAACDIHVRCSALFHDFIRKTYPTCSSSCSANARTPPKELVPCCRCSPSLGSGKECPVLGPVLRCPGFALSISH